MRVKLRSSATTAQLRSYVYNISRSACLRYAYKLLSPNVELYVHLIPASSSKSLTQIDLQKYDDQNPLQRWNMAQVNFQQGFMGQIVFIASVVLDSETSSYEVRLSNISITPGLCFNKTGLHVSFHIQCTNIALYLSYLFFVSANSV